MCKSQPDIKVVLIAGELPDQLFHSGAKGIRTLTFSMRARNPPPLVGPGRSSEKQGLACANTRSRVVWQPRLYPGFWTRLGLPRILNR